MGATAVYVEGLTLQGDGSTTVLRALAVVGNNNHVRNCTIRNVMASWAAIGIGGVNGYAQNIYASGSTCALGILWMFSIQAVVDNFSGQDGSINGSPCWVLLDNQPPFDTYRLCRNISCDESNGSWVRAAASGVFGAGRIGAVELNGVRGIKGHSAACVYVATTDRLTVKNFTPEPAGEMYCLELSDVASARVQFAKTLKVTNTAPVALVKMDSSCGYVEFDDVDFNSLDSAAAVVHRIESGQRSLVVPGATGMSPGLLLKADPTNAGRYLPAQRPTDSISSVVGILARGPARATTGPFAMPYPSAIAPPGYFYVNNDANVSVGAQYEFSTTAVGFLGGAWIPIHLDAFTGPSGLGSAFATGINSTSIANCSISATHYGSGIIELFCKSLGASGTRSTTGSSFPNNGQNAMLTANAGALVGGSVSCEVSQIGQIRPMQSDGATSIAIGNFLTLSPSALGRVAPVATGNYVAVAMAALGATAGGLVSALFQKGIV